ncbi:MAG: class I SAM-dependent methyltransferase [Lentisphaerae bacterium]|nr:class I SAM-dependent methyltransferase [Lentisphaerota bacterium]
MNNDKKNLSWKNYYQKTNDIPPRPALLKALSSFDNEVIAESKKVAVDLGCGAGGDSIKLLETGWSVFSIDKEYEAIKTLRVKASNKFDKLKAEVQLLEEIISLPNSLLVNASLSLPFCKPQNFNELWSIIAGSIQSGGRFSGSLFGDRDEWSNNKSMTFLKIEQVYELFSDFDIEYFHERDEIGPTATVENKHWHSFLIVAKKS